MNRPYQPKTVSNEDVSLLEITADPLQEETLELVQPRHRALSEKAFLDPFKSDIDWTTKEAEMFQLMDDKLGMGLAAPQVGSNYRMFVMAHSHLGYIGCYNPKVLEAEGEVTLKEGCLTFPLLFINVERAERIKVRYTKTDGETDVEVWMDGMDARCFLHEIDHLEGVLFLDRVSELKLKRAQASREKLLKKLDRVKVR
jgi:peptide deformylase